MMQDTTTLADFMSRVRKGPAYFRTSIDSISGCIDELTRLLLTLTRDPLKLLEQEFRAICPRCSGWVEQSTLGLVWTYSDVDSDRLVMTSYGDVSRLRDGHCVNPDCPSGEIILIWKGSQRTKDWILDHLGRLRKDLGAKLHALPAYLDRLTRPNILNFVADTIEALRERQELARDGHLCRGQGRHDFVIWVSVILGTMDNVRQVISGNLLTGMLCSEGYDSRRQAFAHWVAAEDRLNLALIPEKELAAKDRFLIVPAETLSETDRLKWGR